MIIADEIGLPAVLEQTAEECAELAHACLKLARILRKENPTPAQKIDVLEKIEEEAADVDVCIEALTQADVIAIDGLCYRANDKFERWKNRINEMKNNKEKEN